MSPELDAFIHFLCLSVALIAYVLNRKRKTTFIKLAAVYLLVTLLLDGFAAAIWLTDFMSAYVDHNLFVYHLLTPIQYSIIVLMYRSVIRNQRYRKILSYTIPVFWLLSVLNAAFLQPLSYYTSYTLLLKYVLSISFVLYFFFEILHAEHYFDLPSEPAFWISTGILFHSIGNVFVQGAINYFLDHAPNGYQFLNTVSAFLNYALFISFLVGFIYSNYHGFERRLDS
jgi:hypothetical protein